VFDDIDSIFATLETLTINFELIAHDVKQLSHKN